MDQVLMVWWVRIYPSPLLSFKCDFYTFYLFSISVYLFWSFCFSWIWWSHTRRVWHWRQWWVWVIYFLYRLLSFCVFCSHCFHMCHLYRHSVRSTKYFCNSRCEEKWSIPKSALQIDSPVSTCHIPLNLPTTLII